MSPPLGYLGVKHFTHTGLPKLIFFKVCHTRLLSPTKSSNWREQLHLVGIRQSNPSSRRIEFVSSAACLAWRFLIFSHITFASRPLHTQPSLWLGIDNGFVFFG
jgi:hypothetical protein